VQHLQAAFREVIVAGEPNSRTLIEEKSDLICSRQEILCRSVYSDWHVFVDRHNDGSCNLDPEI
jgi:hypothetical protein